MSATDSMTEGYADTAALWVALDDFTLVSDKALISEVGLAALARETATDTPEADVEEYSRIWHVAVRGLNSIESHEDRRAAAQQRSEQRKSDVAAIKAARQQAKEV